MRRREVSLSLSAHFRYSWRVIYLPALSICRLEKYVAVIVYSTIRGIWPDVQMCANWLIPTPANNRLVFLSVFSTSQYSATSWSTERFGSTFHSNRSWMWHWRSFSCPRCWMRSSGIRGAKMRRSTGGFSHHFAYYLKWN
jgi:hypothetical protein